MRRPLPHLAAFLERERSPRASAIAVAAMLFGGAFLSMQSLWREAEATAESALARELQLLVGVASRDLDIEAHADIVEPEQLNDADYLAVAAPLYRLVDAVPSVRFIYTTRRSGDAIVFGVDAAHPEDTDGDGMIDQAALGAVYEDAPDALRRAFDTGELITATEPYSDAWGSFVAAFQPLRRSDGELECVLAVEYDASAYASRLAAMDTAVHWGLGVAALVSALLGAVVYVVQRQRARVGEQLVSATSRAEAASRAKSDFLANMSHEIRTPMTSILGYAEMVRDDIRSAGLGERHTEELEIILRNGHHLLSVINDILDISKIEAGHMEVESIATAPLDIVEDVVELIRPRAVQRGLALEVEIGEDVPRHVLSDPLRLRQILMNLLSNAVKFTQRGTISVRLDAALGELELMVRDSGMGMDTDQLARVFEPFEQADSSVTRNFGGTGLGLPISRRLAEMLGGTLTATSTPDQGSTFTLRLPAPVAEPPAPLPAPAVERSTEANDDGAPLAGLRVLLAEDSAVNRRLVTRIMSRAGAVVHEVENGRQAVEALSLGGTFDAALQRPAPFDVVLMDMQMPVLDGYNAARVLRSRGFRGAIVALTAHAMTSDRAKSMHAGCDDYATKPIERAALIATCRAAAERTRARAASSHERMT